MSSLAALVEQSQRLASAQNGAAAGVELPSIHLGLDQIESQSRRIAGRSAKGGQAGNAAYLLASGGVNAEHLASTIDRVQLAGTFEPLIPLNDTDVEGFLRHTHEQSIISSIEEGRRQTNDDFYTQLDSQMRRDWERQKERLFEELGRHQVGTGGPESQTPRKKGTGGGFDRGSPSTSTATPSAGSTLQMHAKMMRYDRVVRRLNEYRKDGFNFALAHALADAATAGAAANDAKAAQTADTYALLAAVVRERDVQNGEFQREAVGARQYAAAYQAQAESEDGRGVRKMVGRGGREWLEGQFMEHVEKTLTSRPAEAALGGVPSVQNKIRGFLNVKFLKNGQWATNPSLEIANNTPVWARIYYLLRSGHPKEALAFATDNEAAIRGLEKDFVAYLKAWLDAPDRRLPKLLRDRFLSEYNQRIRYLTDSSDPYKHALYKLIGRVELSRRNVPGVTATTEDWLWFQLSLVREGELQDEAPHERYGLRDLARVLLKFGEQHFDPKGTRPLLYFQVLLLSGQFERAVGFLYQHPSYQADAVHFAIALAYYGLLRVAPRTKSNEVELLVLAPGAAGAEPSASLNFARLLHRYTRQFVQSDAAEAVQYLYLICLGADLPAPAGQEQVALCHDYVRELVMESRAWTELLGDVRGDGTVVPGMLQRDLKLLHLADSKAYLGGIVKAAAARADQERRWSEAVMLYNLAEEHDSVIAVLNVELGLSLSQPASSTTAANASSSGYFKPGVETVSLQSGDVVAQARSILAHYDRLGAGSRPVSRRNRETCLTLLRLKEAMTLYETGQYDAALAAIEEVGLVPLSSDIVGISRAAEDFKSLDEAVVRNFDVILLAAMNVIYQLHKQLKESPFGDASRQQRMGELRGKARSLMMFAGMLRYRLTGETYGQLTRLDVFIH